MNEVIRYQIKDKGKKQQRKKTASYGD